MASLRAQTETPEGMVGVVEVVMRYARRTSARFTFGPFDDTAYLEAFGLQLDGDVAGLADTLRDLPGVTLVE